MNKTAREILMTKREKPVLSKECAVSTGSTLLNLASTDLPDLALRKGCYYLLVGDSSSGKTWISHSLFAEASINSAFKDYEFVYDDVEYGAQMDVEFYFGKETARRMRPPRVEKGEAVFSETVEDFYYNITNWIKKEKKFIYVLDSENALSSEAADEKFEKKKKSAEGNGEEVKGSYGDGKAKYHSEHLRHVVSGLRRTGSILIIVSQTRDNLGMGFEKKTRSGGKALRFYASLEFWTAVHEKIKKLVRGKERTIGGNIFIEVKKNRVTGKVGKDRAVKLPIYYNHGIDDVGSCVDFLIEEQHWQVKEEKEKEIVYGTGEDGKKKKRKGTYNAHDLAFQGSREKIIAYIEEEDLEDRLKKIVAQVWAEIEEESSVKRKKRYE